MQRVVVDGNVFEFEDTCRVEKYDEWPFYRDRVLRSVENGAAKGCDLVAIDGDVLYLIEGKDYTAPAGTTMPKVDALATTVSTKGFHTLAGLRAGAHLSGHPQQEFCRAALACSRIVLCLAVEPPGKPNSRLWSQDKPLGDLKTALRRRVRYLDARPMVISNHSSHDGLPWTSHRATSATE